MRIQMTTFGQRCLQAAIAGSELKFTNCEIGSGTTQTLPTNSIVHRELTATIRKITNKSTKTILSIYFDNTNVSSGFNFKEIGIYAEDPTNPGTVGLYMYGCSEEGDYIPPASEIWIEELYDVEVYTSNASNVSAVIDASVVYVTKDEFEDEAARQDAAREACLNAAKEYTNTQINTLPDSALSGSYNDLLNAPIVNLSTLRLNDNEEPTIEVGKTYSLGSLYVNGTQDGTFTNSIVRAYRSAANNDIYISIIAGNNLTQNGYNYYAYYYSNGSWIKTTSRVRYSTTDIEEGSALETGTFYYVYEE